MRLRTRRSSRSWLRRREGRRRWPNQRWRRLRRRIFAVPGQADDGDARPDQRLAAYQTDRLFVYRDIGILPYDEWEAFSELFPSQYHGPIIGQAPAGGTGFTPPAAARRRTPSPVRSSARWCSRRWAWRVPFSNGRRDDQAPQGIFLANPNADIVTQEVRLGELKLRWSRRAGSRAKEPGCLLPGRGRDDDHLDQARRNAGDEGRGRLRAGFGRATGQSHEPDDHDRERQGNFGNATLTREVAEIAVVEYEEGIFKQEFATVEGEIKLAESDLSRAEDRVDWAAACSRRATFRRRQRSRNDCASKRQDLPSSKRRKEESAARLHQGQDDQRAQERGREGDSDEQAKKATLELETTKEKKLAKQIAACIDHRPQRRPGGVCQRPQRGRS